MTKFLQVFFLSICLAGCTAIDPLTRAQNYISKGKFENAIKILERAYKENPKSIPVKSLLAQTYSDYGLHVCQDSDRKPKEKYGLAKEQFIMALELNPYLTDASDMLEMIEKIQQAFKKTETVQNPEDLKNIDDEIARAKAEETLKENEQTKNNFENN